MEEWMNIFKPKSWIRFYSLEPAVVDLYPIITAHSLKRSWQQPEIKKSKCPFSGMISSSNCPGITNIANAGYIMTAPADFIITTNGDGITFQWEVPYLFKFSDNNRGYINKHDSKQTEPLLDNSDNTLREIVKVETPWRIKSSNDIVILQLPVTYNNEKRFTPATGIIDPKYAHVLNVQLFWHVMEGEVHIKAGTPLCQYIPMNRKYLNLNNFDTIIDSAGDLEYSMEESFQYANQCNAIRFDSVQSRINRVTEIFKKYRKPGVKL
jgi:hypothetical protein